MKLLDFVKSAALSLPSRSSFSSPILPSHIHVHFKSTKSIHVISLCNGVGPSA